jgi:hypothetical protein
MVANDDAGALMPCGVLKPIASMLAPTGYILKRPTGQSNDTLLPVLP